MSAPALDDFLCEFGEPDADAACERFFTVAEAAVLLGVSQKTIRRRIRSGHIRKAAIGGRAVRIPASEIARIASGRAPEEMPNTSTTSQAPMKAYHE